MQMVKSKGVIKSVFDAVASFLMPTRIQGNYLYSLPYNAWNKEDYLKSFLDIPELNAVICTKARMFGNGCIKEVDSNGEEIENSKLVNILNNPNWFQSGQEFRRQTKLFREIFGNEYLFELFPVGRDLESASSKALYTLPPNWMEVEYNAPLPFFMYTETPDGVKYKINYKNKEYPIPTDTIIHLNDDRVQMSDKYGNSGNMLKGESKLKALTPATNNLKMAYETRGTLLKNRGALGILSNATSDKVGAIPLDPEEKKRIQQEYTVGYGGLEGQSQLIISTADLRWQQMSISPDKMGLYTETAADFDKIIDSYGMKRELFAGNSATYENQKEAKKSVYIDTIIPDANEWIAGFNKKYRAGAKTKLIMDYFHLPLFQEDLEARGRSLDANINALSKALQDQAITIDQYKTELEKFGIKSNSETITD
jgi:phage portal protein BeeE